MLVDMTSLGPDGTGGLSKAVAQKALTALMSSSSSPEAGGQLEMKRRYSWLRKDQVQRPI